MQIASASNPEINSDRDLKAALPLYAASLLVTLAGVGAVGVTMNSVTWLPLWSLLAVIGHGVSIALRKARVAPENVFYPVMLFGSVVVLQQTMSAGALGGVDLGLSGQPMDMATASVVGALAVVRCFTLVTDSALVFSPVPTITMLALVGSSNLNAEVPIFFGLFLLSSLFLTGYEAHLRRMRSLNRAGGPPIFHLLMAWAITLAVGVVALLFPLLVQPVLGQVSPFNIPAMNRVRTLPPFTQLNNQRASVGQGPINLSPTPVYEVYTSEAGKLRTAVFSAYSNREWRQGMYDYPAEVRPQGTVNLPPFPGDAGQASYQQYQYRFDPYPDVRADVPRHEVLQRVFTRGYNSQGIPGLGHIKELHYPHQFVSLHPSGCVSGTAHVSSGKAFEVISSIIDPSPAELRAARPIDRNTFAVADSLALPQSAERVQSLAQRITTGLTNDYDRVQAVLGYIEKNCQYTLQEEATPAGEDAADYYLFTTKRGACDLAATAAAIMCRSVGIPARVAVGYVMEEPLPQGGGFLVRQEHAHMWTEVYFPEYGWIPFDAAPPLARIKDNPLQVAWLRFIGLFSKIGGGGLDAVLLVVVIAGTLILSGSWAFSALRRRVGGSLRRLRGGLPQEAIAGAYERALQHLARRGWGRDPWMTPSEYLAALEPDWTTPEHAGALAGLRRLTEVFQRAHYGGEASAADLAAAEEAAKSVCRLTPRRKLQRAPLAPPSAAAAEGAA